MITIDGKHMSAPRFAYWLTKGYFPTMIYASCGYLRCCNPKHLVDEEPYRPKYTTLEEAFWSKVRKQPARGCWIWRGYRMLGGYGKLSYGGHALRAHRVAYQIYVGPIPLGLNVCHRCDNPPCVNPAHLFLGTHSDNVRDRHEKRRDARGEKHGCAKITKADAVAIRRARKKKTASVRQLAVEYGVSRATIYEIVNGKIWK